MNKKLAGFALGLVLMLLLNCEKPKAALQGSTVEFSTGPSLHLKYNVYTPPFYQTYIDSIYPALYLLHGHGGDHNDWFQVEEGNVSAILDSLIVNELIPPVVAFSLDADNSWYIDRQIGMESFYMNEFIAETERKFRIDRKKGRYMAGNSAGGYGALRFALKYPSRFDDVMLLSPAAYHPLPPEVSSSRKTAAFELNGTFSDSVWRSFSYIQLLDSLKNGEDTPKYYLSVGDDDIYNIVPVVSRLQQIFLDNDIENELRITDGGHDWTCWKENFANSLVEIFKDR